jgi:DNA mismatch repair protein MutS2
VTAQSTTPDERIRARIPNRAIEDLKWRRVLERLQALCITEVGQRLAQRTAVWADVETIRVELLRVSEMRGLLDAGKTPPLSGIGGIGEALGRATQGSALAGEALLLVAESLRNSNLLRSYIVAREAEVPRIAFVASRIPDLTHLSRMVFATFDASGKIRDDATPKLADLRRRLTSAIQRTKRQLDEYLNAPEYDLVFQDDYYTLRDGRYVLPVKSSDKALMGGILHGHSNTGQTAYVEPPGMIALNNELISVRDEIEREEYTVLRDRTDRIVAELDAIGEMLDAVAELDHIHARALLAAEMGASAPQVNLRGHIKLLSARNPALILKGTKVVANDIEVGQPWRMLVITGPNTGGKTVTLMTVGLLVMMTQAGMHIPAGPDSLVGIFPRIFTLFGDPQSLEQDLSTFSGHLAQVREVLSEAGPGELVLMDEIIVGTEPSGGAALAIAVLEELAERRAVGVVTTHYDRLKTLSLSDPRFQNASVGLDGRTQAPNYVLTMGVPGSSSPIEMARRLGLPGRIVDRAVEVLGRREQDLQAALETVEGLRRGVEEERQGLRAERRQQIERTKELEAEKERVRRMSERMAADLKAEVMKDLTRARDEVRELIKKLQGSQDMRQVEAGRREIERVRAAVQARVPDAPPGAPKPPPAGTIATSEDSRAVAPGELQAGLQVQVKSLKQLGVVRSVLDGGKKVEVAVGALRVTVEAADLRVPNRQDVRREKARAREEALPEPPPSTPPPGAPPGEPVRVRPPRVAEYTVDVRGHRVDEAMDAIDRALDAAVMSGKSAIYVVHGHGTGALKRGVREALARHKQVATWRPADPEEGGDGCTVVEL